MTGLGALIRRNCKLFFKDKGMFFTSLITPVILLVLYATFLAKVYRDSFAAAMPAGFAVDAALIDGTVGGQLVSSLLAVCCVTVAFCSNLLMVQDRISGARRDLTMTPVRRSTLALGYFAASALSTLLICYAALAVCLGYLAVTGRRRRWGPSSARATAFSAAHTCPFPTLARDCRGSYPSFPAHMGRRCSATTRCAGCMRR